MCFMYYVIKSSLLKGRLGTRNEHLMQFLSWCRLEEDPIVRSLTETSLKEDFLPTNHTDFHLPAGNSPTLLN